MSSAIARPLDMRYVSNRAVVRLMPVAVALLVALLALLSGQLGLAFTAVVWAALAGVAGSAAVVRPWLLRRMT